MHRLGIDVGGTHTDAVWLDGDTVVAAVKAETTRDVETGIVNAVSRLLSEPGVGSLKGSDLDAVMLGTTHFTNAVVERRELGRIGAIRIGPPVGAAGPALGPFVDWPHDLRDIVRGPVFALEGGHEVDGRLITPFDRRGMEEAARRMADDGVSSVAITGVFSPLCGDHEVEAGEIVQAFSPKTHVTLSRDLGRIGLLGRENAALLNASVVSLARKTTAAFERALVEIGIRAPLFLTQNDGTIARAAVVARFPVFCFASGPTNSMRGAAFLSGLKDALVIDVGGTTSDVGALKAGFPREANNIVEVGGVRTLFRMPDLLSIGLGGGSRVREDPVRVGPDSLGYRLRESALVFGGETLTATDIGVAGKLIELGDSNLVGSLSRELVRSAQQRIESQVSEAVDRMKNFAAEEPLVAVGGGAFLVPQSIPGISEVLQVEHRGVANALGAAMAQVSGETDRVFTGISREDALRAATDMARARAEEAGAVAESVDVVEVEDLPLAYLPGDARRVRVRVAGHIGKLS